MVILGGNSKLVRLSFVMPSKSTLVGSSSNFKYYTRVEVKDSDKDVSLARSLPLKWGPIWGSTLVGSTLNYKYYTRFNMTDSDKDELII